MPERIWTDVAYGNLRQVVTTSSCLYHAGISEPLRATAIVETSTATASTDTAVEDSDKESESDGQSSDEDDEKGFKNHSFDVMMCSMRLGLLLKNADNIKDAVRNSLGICAASQNAQVQHPASQLVENFSSITVPGRGSVDRGWLRLDVTETLFERAKNMASRFGTCCRSLMADSSTKMYNYFCVRERRFFTSKAMCKTPPSVSAAEVAPAAASGRATSTANVEESQSKSAMDIEPINASQIELEQFAWMVTCFGYGASNVIYKARNLIHSALLRCGTDAALDKWRLSVVGWTSDSGTERKLADIGFVHRPCLQSLRQFASDVFNCEKYLQEGSLPQMNYLFPFGLFMFGHIHMAMNALHAAIERSRIWPGFEKGFRALLSFLNNRDLRKRFQVTCVPEADRHLFKKWKKELLDWRWESMGELLKELNPVLPALQAHFDLGKIRSGGSVGSLGEIDTAVLKVVSSFLQLDWLLPICETLRLVSCEVNDFVGWLESCECHEWIWCQPCSYEKRQKMFRLETGLDSCWRKGCRGHELASGKVEYWLNRICSVSSPRLTALLTNLSAEKRSSVLAIQQDLQESLREEFTAKLQQWHHLPYALLGLLSSDSNSAKHVARNCRSEYQSCDKARLHRVALRFFEDPTVSRQFDAFCDTPVCLDELPELWNLVVMYNSISLVERAIEGEHAKIEKLAKHALPCSICSRLRADYLQTLLLNAEFNSFARSVWAKHVYQMALSAAYSRSVISKLPSAARLEKIYLYGTEEQYSDETSLSLAIKDWNAVSEPKLMKFAHPGTSHLALLWLRSRLTTGKIYAIASEIMQGSLISYVSYKRADYEAAPVQDIVSLVSCDELVASKPDRLSNMTFFKVLNAFPNQRLVGHPWHLGDKPSAAIAIVRYMVHHHLNASCDSANSEDMVHLRPAFQTEYLCLHSWSTRNFCDVVQGLFSFTNIQFGSKATILPSVLRVLGESPVPLPAVDKSEKSLMALAAYGDLPMEQRTASYSVVRDALHSESFQDAGRFMQLPSSIPADVVTSLVESGFITTRYSDSGVINAIALRSAAVQWKPVLRLSAPCLEFNLSRNVGSIVQHSTLDLMLILHRQGFEAAQAVPRFWSTDGSQVYNIKVATGGWLPKFSN
jgi:hypothetical protein